MAGRLLDEEKGRARKGLESRRNEAERFKNLILPRLLFRLEERREFEAKDGSGVDVEEEAELGGGPSTSKEGIDRRRNHELDERLWCCERRDEVGKEG